MRILIAPTGNRISFPRHSVPEAFCETFKQVLTGGTPGSTSTQKDLLVNTESNPVLRDAVALILDQLHPNQPKIEISGTAVVDDSADHTWIATTGGSLVISLDFGMSRKRFEFSLQADHQEDILTASGFKEGSLAKAMLDWFEDKTLSGGDNSILSGVDHETSTYQQNDSAWFSSLDLSGVPIAKLSAGSWGSFYRGALISPRHYICAAHVWPGSVPLRWLGADSQVYERTITDSYSVTDRGSEFYIPDTRIGQLDSALPSAVAHYPLLTQKIDFLPGLVSGVEPFANWSDFDQPILMPIFAVKPGGMGNLLLCSRISGEASTDSQRITHNSYEELNSVPSYIPSRFGSFSSPVVGGHSGHPAFLPTPVPTLLLTHNGDGVGIHFGDYKTQIANWMTELGGGYTPSVTDTSEYEDFGE
ncbi:hypothetical protein [Crateriforma conspicua]|uniref:Trypsin n=1 Tax=Crateriforma conspicua TaxID=2527996 RepID=A0A5C6FZP1_9PLAN|nr:hypothetical protein [Crateriforma conspicua]TWU66453.1 hypothetical protein V7x_20190 [Crateriforma conspicua]